MVLHTIETVSDGRRQRLLEWVLSDGFKTVLDIIQSRVAAGLAEHARIVHADPGRYLRNDPQTALEIETLRTVSEWITVRKRLEEIRNIIVDTDVSITVGKQITVD